MIIQMKIHPHLFFSQTGDPTVGEKSMYPYFIGVAVFLILLILLLGVLAAKKKHKHGVLWLPDGFSATKNDKRREPVGQDDFDMK